MLERGERNLLKMSKREKNLLVRPFFNEETCYFDGGGFKLLSCMKLLNYLCTKSSRVKLKCFTIHINNEDPA